MYRGRLWTMRQYAGFGTAEESNRRYRYLLSQGITGLSVAFDLPTQMGMDSDHPLAAGEVGRVGVAICSLADMQRLFEGIRLADITTSMTINSTAAILLCFYVLVARSQGADLAKISGTIQNDILKEYIARGTYIYPPRPAMRIITDLFAWAARELPEWNTISISGYHIREAGSTAIQEVAFTLANAIAYIERRHRRRAGGGCLRAAPFVLLQRAQQFPGRDRQVPRRAAAVREHHARALRRPQSPLDDAALPRADRRLHAHRAAARRQRGARLHAGAGGGAGRRAVPAHQRQGRGARAAHRRSRRGWRCARSRSSRTKRGVTSTADPFGGSYYIEKLTDEIERGAEEYIERIDAMGGTLAAIENGFIQNEIQNAAYAYQQRVERGEHDRRRRKQVSAGGGEPPATFRLDPELEAQQIARLRELRASRDAPRSRCQPLRPRRRRPFERQPDAPHPGLRRSIRHRRRNFGPSPRRVWRISRTLAPFARRTFRRQSTGSLQQVAHGIGLDARKVHEYVGILEVMIGNEVGLRIRRNQVLPILDAHPHHQSTNIIPQPRNQLRPLHFKRGRSVRGALLDVIQHQRYFADRLESHRTTIL